MATARYVRGNRNQAVITSAAAVQVDEIIPVDNNILIAFNSVDASGMAVVASFTGEYEAAKTNGREIKAGERVSWVSATGMVDNNAITPAAGDVVGFGIATVDAADTASTARFFLTPNAGVRS